MKKRIYLSPPHMNGSEREFIDTAFENNWIAPSGPNLTGFEREICEFIGLNHGVALTSGTAAIHLALRYLGVGKGDVVFCSDLTFSGSCNPVVYQGAELVFVDAERNSLNMCPQALEIAFIQAKLQGKLPKAIIIVDIFGQSADYSKLLPLCAQYGVAVIEDAAEALGTEYKGKKCGVFGDVGILSFNGNKIITTSGGGMAVSSDKKMIEKMYFWANQSKEDMNYYLHKELGFNYRMSNICAGIGRGQMKTLEDRIDSRRAIYEYYKESFADLPVRIQPVLEGCKPNYWLSVVFLDDECGKCPDDIIEHLEAQDIEARRMWYPMHCQPFFEGAEYYKAGETSVSEDVFNRGICLPSGSAMTPEDLERVCVAFSAAFGGEKNAG
jgi:pyridoxal phosphate-dependent aminotransferase EpsN